MLCLTELHYSLLGRGIYLQVSLRDYLVFKSCCTNCRGDKRLPFSKGAFQLQGTRCTLFVSSITITTEHFKEASGISHPPVVQGRISEQIKDRFLENLGQMSILLTVLESIYQDHLKRFIVRQKCSNVLNDKLLRAS